MHRGTSLRLLMLLALVWLFTTGIPVPALGQAKPTVHWKALGYSPEPHWLTVTYRWWSEQVRQKTDGRLVVDVYPLGGLPYKQAEALSVAAQGLVEVAEVWGGSLGGSESALEVPDLPGFVPPNFELRKKLLAELLPEWRRVVAEKHNGHVYSVVQLDPRNLYAKKEIKDLGGLRGLKIRAIGALESAFTNRLGAVATSISWPDTYVAMQQGVIDGFWIVDSATLGSKMYEVSRHIIDVQTGGASSYLVINRKAWETLPQDLRKALEDLQPVFLAKMQENHQNDMARSRKGLVDNGMKVVKWSQEDLSKMDQIANNIRQEWYAKADPQGKRLFDQAKQFIQR